MADEIAYKVSVDTGGGAKNLKQLKDEFKAAQDELSGLTEGTKDYTNALGKLAGIKDQIGDLNDRINAFNPDQKFKAFGNVVGHLASGFTAAQGAMALFGSESEDLQKTLVKVQAAMAFSEGIKGIGGLGDSFKTLWLILKANPIIAIVTAIAGIGTALFALKDKIKPVADAFNFLGGVIDKVLDSGKRFLDWIGVTSFALDKQRESIIKNNELIKKSVSDRYDSEIEAAKRAGKETEGLEIKKLMAITQSNSKIIEQINLNKSATEEEKKQKAQLLEENRKYYIEIQNLADASADRAKKREEDKTKKNKEELEKQHKDSIDAYNKKADFINAQIDAEEAQAKADKEKAKTQAQNEFLAAAELKAIQNETDIQSQVEFLDAQMQVELANTELTESEKALIVKKYEQQKADLKRQYNEDSFNAEMQIAQASNDALISLSNTLFSIKRSNLERGSAAELKLAKRQFQINKALSLATTIISTVQGMVKAISQNPPPSPLGFIGAGLVGTAGTIASVKIATTKFEDGGGGSVGGGLGGSAPPSVSAPAIAPPQQGSTQLNPDGTVKQPEKVEPPTVKAVVVETDITKTTNRVNKIEESAKVG